MAVAHRALRRARSAQARGGELVELDASSKLELEPWGYQVFVRGTAATGRLAYQPRVGYAAPVTSALASGMSPATADGR